MNGPTSNIRLAPLMEVVAQLTQQRHDRPARILTYTGLGVAGLASVGALVINVLAYHDPGLVAARETFGSMCYFGGLMGVVAAAAGGLRLDVQKGHRETRAENAHRAAKLRDDIKADVAAAMTAAMAAAERERLRHEMIIKEVVEETATGLRHVEARLPSMEEHLEKRMDTHLNRIGSAVVKVGEQVGRVERAREVDADLVRELVAKQIDERERFRAFNAEMFRLVGGLAERCGTIENDVANMKMSRHVGEHATVAKVNGAVQEEQQREVREPGAPLSSADQLAIYLQARDDFHREQGTDGL